MVTAQITMETGLGLKHRNAAGIVFQPLGTADFEQIVKDTEELLRGAAEDTGTTVETARRRVRLPLGRPARPGLRRPGQAVNMVSTELQAGGYGDRLLAAVFAFEDERQAASTSSTTSSAASTTRSCPRRATQARNNEREFQLKAQLENELPIEPELERWFPLWEIPL